MEIGSTVPVRKNLSVFTIYVCGGHLSYVTRCREQTFIAPTPKGSTLNLVLIDQEVSEEKMFEKCLQTTDKTTMDNGPSVYLKLA